jgi:hypothetical protein
LDHGDGDRLVRSGADGLQHAGMAKGRDIAALLQVKTDLIDAAGRIDREHELQVDRGLRRRRQCRDEREHHRRNSGEEEVASHCG